MIAQRRVFTNYLAFATRRLHYVQGQSPEPRIREYFYYIDHQGQLFLDDAKMKNFTSCFKDKSFLEFFFQRLRMNETGRYEEFPYLSLCGRERNFVRCDDLPIVFTQVVEGTEDQPDHLVYNQGTASKMVVPLQPRLVCMLPESGRVYHPAPSLPLVGGVGLVASHLAVAFSRLMEFEEGEDRPPTHFTWKGERHALSNELTNKIQELSHHRASTDME